MTTPTQVAVVTGAASGIGQATAWALADAGARVHCVDLRDPAETVTVDPSRLVGHSFDAADSEAWDALVRRLQDDDTGVDSLALVHGRISGVRDTVVDLPRSGWDDLLATNLTGVWLGMRALLPLMTRRGRGSIVCVSSATAVSATPGLAGYVAGKSGVIGLARQAAVEYATAGVRVNAVAPGIIDTPILDRRATAFLDSIERQTPLGRMGTATEVAAAICFLLSDQASFITGHVLHVDGGLLAQAAGLG